MKSVFLIGRVVFGGFFLYSGIHHFQQREGLAKYAGAKNVPLPEEAVTITGALMVLAGASIILGVKPKFGALGVASFLAAVSPAMHNFWTQADPQVRQNDMIHFSKNIALMGAALALAGVKEPWPASLPVE